MNRPVIPAVRIRVVHAPCHAPSLKRSHIRHALSLGADSVAFSETYWRQKYLHTRPRWRAFTGSSKRRDHFGKGRPVGKDVTILVRRRHKIIDHGSFRGARQSTPLKIAPERWVPWVIYRVGGEDGFLVLHVAVHPHAAVEHAWDSDRARKYRHEMRKVKRLIRRKRTEYEDLHVLLTGDLNYHPNGPDRPGSPRHILRALHMHWVARGLDWFAWSHNLRVAGAARYIAPRENGQDHDWIVRDLWSHREDGAS